MQDANTIVRDRQLAIRREMDRRGIHLKQVANDSRIPYPTIISYFPGEKDRQPATIPGSAIYALLEGKALPLDLMSLLLPAGMHFIHAPEEIDHDDLEAAARDYLAAKGAAHHPNSPAGREISACEDARLRAKAAHLTVIAA